MLIIGLTGGIGSGKSTVADLFADHKVHIIDTDIIAHQLVRPESKNLATIVQKMGESILNPDMSLNRQALRKHVLQHPDDLAWLERLLHPQVRAAVSRQLKQLSEDYCIVVIPLLVETLPHPMIDRILVVDSPEAQQIERTLARNPDLSESELDAMMSRQASREHRLSFADDVIDNSGELSALEAQIAQLDQKYRNLPQ